MFRNPSHQSQTAHIFRNALRRKTSLVKEDGAALLEFAIALPLLVVFVVGIFDFSGAFNQKQKIEQAAQEGAIIAGGQPISDIDTSNANPDSLQPVVTTVFNSLVASGIIAKGGCNPPGTSAHIPATGLKWRYTIPNCSTANPGDQLIITINRGISSAGPPASVSTSVQVAYPYHWRFGGVIQLLFPGASYASPTVTESATVHNQT